MRLRGKHFAIAVLALFSIRSWACVALHAALNAPDTPSKTMALTSVYTAWLEALRPTSSEIAALAIDPLSLPPVEASRAQESALLDRIRAIHSTLPEEERTAWLSTARALVQSRLAPLITRDENRGIEATTERPTAFTTAWGPLAHYQKEQHLLPDGRALTQGKIVTYGQGNASSVVVEGFDRYFGREPLIPDHSGKFAVHKDTGKWFDLTTATTATAPPVEAAFRAGWKIENLRFSPENRWAVFESNKRAYRYDLKTPGARPEPLRGLSSAVAILPSGESVLGLRPRYPKEGLRLGVERTELIVSKGREAKPIVVLSDAPFVRTAVVSPDGKSFLAVVHSGNGSPKSGYYAFKIDAGTGQIVEEWNLNPVPFHTRFAFSPDGKTLVTVRISDDDTSFQADVRSTDSKKVIASGRWEQAFPGQIAFDSQSKQIAFVGNLRREKDREAPLVLIHDYTRWLETGWASGPRGAP